MLSSESPSEQEIRAIQGFIQERIEDMASQEIEKARARMKDRIPELAAKIGVRLQQALSHKDFEAYLTIVLRKSFK